MSSDEDIIEISDRAQHLLKTLVEVYIRDGQPVGSRTLTRSSGLSVSAATVRNVMSDLEEQGYISAPHTSAGRVPTDKGYRLFVDTLLKVQPLSAPEVQQLQQQLGGDHQPGAELASSASNMLSAITQLAGVVTVPTTQHYAQLRQIEFLPLSDNRVLAILVINAQDVQNRILHLNRSYSQSELQVISNYLNQQFAGRDISQVRAALLEGLSSTRESMNQAMMDAIQIAHQALDDSAGVAKEYVLAGQTNLMSFEELAGPDTMRELFEAFNRQRDILHLLDQCLSADGVQIFIGQESSHAGLEECSLVTAPYTLNDEVVGVLGVIGPTRMAYERVIPIVDVTAKLLGAALKYNPSAQ